MKTENQLLAFEIKNSILDFYLNLETISTLTKNINLKD